MNTGFIHRNQTTRKMMISKILRFVGAITATALTAYVMFFSQAPTAQAVDRPTNADIFTGRIIPAFIGEAYDPEQAFAELAGLPVYVFSFDFWGGFNDQGVFTGDSWVNSSIAVKTQIRADGSFQAQGLPVGAYYGVYFPFVLNGGNVQRTDCTDGSFNWAINSYNDIPTNPCRLPNLQPNNLTQSPRQWAFRMPEPDDKIVDVFSYKANYLANDKVKVVDSQVSVTAGGRPFEQIALKHAFVTNRRDLDIANNINTFPVVPNTTLRMMIRTPEPAGAKFDVWAVRFTRPLAGSANISPVIDFPVIRGRASRVAEQSDASGGFTDYVFQAYAPPGYYAIVFWRKELLSPSYQDWNGESSLNTHKSGVAQQWVQYKPEPGGQGFSDSSDWRMAFNWTNYTDFVVPLDNQIIVWGTVTNQDGYLMSSLQNFGGTPPVSLDDAVIDVKSDLNLSYVGFRTDPNVNPPSVPNQQSRMATLSLGSGGTGLPETAVRGMYAVGMDLLTTSNVPRSDDVTVYLRTDQGGLAKYSQANSSTGFIHSTAGPRRVDLIASESLPGVTGGYDRGILVNASINTYAGAPTATAPASGAVVTVTEVGSDLDIPAENKSYYTDRLGQVHIPPSDLQTIGGTATGSVQLALQFKLNQYIYFTKINYDPSALTTITINPGDFQAGLRKPDRFNLALLNKLEEKLSPETAYAAADSTVTTGLSITLPKDVKIDGKINANIYQITNDQPVQCVDCRLYLPDGTVLAGSNNDLPPSESFVLVVPVPIGGAAIKADCYNSLLGQIVGTQPHCVQVGKVGLTSQTYEIKVQASINGKPVSQNQRITVDSVGNVTPPTLTLNFDINCDAMSDKYIQENSSSNVVTFAGKEVADLNVNFLPRIYGFFAGAACSLGDKFISYAPIVLSGVYKYGLQTRALTQDQPIIDIYNIIRNVVNVLFVLIFVIIAVMTILRYQPEQWHISVLLPQLIIALILANFSLVIVQAMLDLNNFLSATLFQFTQNILVNSLTSAGNKAIVGTATLGGGAAVIASFSAAAASATFGLLALIGGTGGTAIVGIFLLVIMFVGVLAFQIIMLLLVFFARYAIIWLAVIVAPLVFAASVLPWFSNLRDRWFSIITAVTFVQTAVAAILSVGVLLMTIGADENSLFTSFGSAIIGIITLSMGVKLPQKMLGGLGIAVPASAAAASAGFAKWADSRRKRKLAGASQVARSSAEQKELDKVNQPGALRRSGRNIRAGAGLAFRGAANVATLGQYGSMQQQAALYNQEWEEKEDKATTAGKKSAYKKIAAQLQEEKPGGTTITDKQLPFINSIYERAMKNSNYQLSGDDGKPVEAANLLPGISKAPAGERATLKHLVTADGTKSGKNLSLREFYDRWDEMDPQARSALMKEARKFNPGAGTGA